MARARTRVKRTILLLAALALLLLLLGLNQWLPGVWRGGGGGGFRAGGDLGLIDPSKTGGQDDETDGPQDPAAAEAPTEPPATWPPKAGVVIEVRGPDGNAAEGWRLGVGGGGAEDARPDKDGFLKMRGKRWPTEGFRVRHAGRLLRHRHALDVPASHYVVHAPARRTPLRRTAAPVDVVLTDLATGSPLAGAVVTWRKDGALASTTTDALGRAAVAGGRLGDPFPVRIEREGYAAAEHVWLRPRRIGPANITVSPAVTIRTRVRWKDRRPAAIERAVIHAADGRVLAKLGGTGRAPNADLEFKVAASEIAGATLSLHPIRTGVEGLRITLPLKDVGADTTLPEPRTVRIVVRGVEGEFINDAEVLVRFDTGEVGPARAPTPWRTTTNIHGEAQVSLAPGQGCEIVVVKDRLGPAARRVGSLDGSDTTDLVLETGVFIPVQFAPKAGGKRPGLFLAQGTASGVRVQAHADVGVGTAGTLTDRVEIGPLPAGPVELFGRVGGVRADEPQYGWAAEVVEARPAMGTVKLAMARSYPIQLVIEDAYGVPVAGAEVDVTATGTTPPHVVPPTRRARPERSTPKGRFIVRNVRDGSYELRIHAAGYETAVLKRVRPGAAVHFVTLLPASD